MTGIPFSAGQTMDSLFGLSPAEHAHLAPWLRAVTFPQGACLLVENEPGDGCYWIESGEIRLELRSSETDSESVLGYLKPGMFLGEFSLIDSRPRSASAYAHTEVKAWWFSRAGFEELCRAYPATGLAITRFLANGLSGKLRDMNTRLASFMFDGEMDPEIDAMVNRARGAAENLQEWSEPELDRLLQAVADDLLPAAADLAEATVRETGKGNAADKTAKNTFAIRAVLDALLAASSTPASTAAPTTPAAESIREFAAPVGVIFGIVPVTNPVATFIFKSLIALKSRNALILSCHRDAQGVGARTGRIIQQALARGGADRHLIQWIEKRASRRVTAMLMKHPGISLILATGGPSMVKAAYSSGKPAIGVGAGNAPVLVCEDADPAAAAAAIIAGKSFDHGMICASESNLVVCRPIAAAFTSQLQAQGARLLSPDEKHQLYPVLFDAHGELRREAVGQDAASLLAAARLPADGAPRLIVVPCQRKDLTSPWAREILSPVVSLFEIPTFEAGIALSQQILAQQGRGHTAAIHSASPDRLDRFAAAIDASRVIANAPSTLASIGIGSALFPSLTLGCGTFGGNSTTDNVSHLHLRNLKRLVLPKGSPLPAPPNLYGTT